MGKIKYAWVTLTFILLMTTCLSHAIGQQTLFDAALRGDIKTLKGFKKQGGNLDSCDALHQTPLMYAAMAGEVDAVKWLLKQGARIDQQNYFGESALILATTGNHIAVVKLLLKKGAAPDLTDHKGWNALMLSRSTETSSLLIHRGAKINHTSQPGGITPLMVAAQEGYFSLVKLLLEAGADKEMSSAKGLRAIDYATGEKHQKIIQILQ